MDKDKKTNKVCQNDQQKKEIKKRPVDIPGADAHADVGLYDPCTIHLFKSQK